MIALPPGSITMKSTVSLGGQCALLVVSSLVALLTALGGGCAASYATPGAAADLQALGVSRDALTDGSIVQSLGKQPLAQFPTGIAVARVQAPGYYSDTARTWGRGAYCVVTSRDVEQPEQVGRLAKLKGVSGIAPVSRLLLPPDLKSDVELRQAAATLRADMLLVYTLDTTFRVQDKLKPLSVVTLGLSPNQQAQVVCTASAVLMDTRNGYIYGVAEASERGTQLASAWTSSSAVDDARRRTETGAFEKLVDELERTWAGVVHNYAAPGR
jgi:hypothetical protein